MTLRAQLIQAHAAQNWELAALLSQAKERAKAQSARSCLKCGSAITLRVGASISGMCRTCLNFEKHHKRKLAASK